jgi:hypothetical protein
MNNNEYEYRMIANNEYEYEEIINSFITEKSAGWLKKPKICGLGRPNELSTARALDHLEVDHRIDRKTGVVIEADNDRQGTTKPASLSVYEQQCLGSRPAQNVVDRLRQAVIDWIVKERQPLVALENANFHQLVQVLNPSLSIYIERSGDTIRRWLIEELNTKKEEVRYHLAATQSQIHLTFDLWTSPNSLALLAIIAHFVTTAGKVELKLIALRPIYGQHSGENQAAVIIDVVKEFAIQDKLGFFVSDNAKNNDTCVKAVCKEFFPGERYERRRLRCLGHIINLSAKAFLYGKNADIFEVDINDLTARQIEERHHLEILDYWRQKGPVGNSAVNHPIG